MIESIFLTVTPYDLNHVLFVLGFLLVLLSLGSRGGYLNGLRLYGLQLSCQGSLLNSDA